MEQLAKQAKNDNDVFQHPISDGEKPIFRFRSVSTIPYTDMQSLLEQIDALHAMLCSFYGVYLFI